jgi:hypothetical protein
MHLGALYLEQVHRILNALDDPRVAVKQCVFNMVHRAVKHDVVRTPNQRLYVELILDGTDLLEGL